MARVLFPMVALALLALSCAGAELPWRPDAGARDGGTAPDGGAADDGGLDAGLFFDGGSPAPDGGTEDGGAAAADGGGPGVDGGLPDGGGLVDGGPTDAVCASSRDCQPNMVCGELRVVGSLVEARCVAPRASPPAVPVGGPCAADSECREGICLETLSGECSVVCADAALDCPADFVCTSYRVNQTLLGFCNRTCADSAACEAATPGNICTFNQNALRNTIDRVCLRPFGAGALGATCASGADCLSGICLTTTIFTGTPCPTGTECPANHICRCPPGQQVCPNDQRQCVRTEKACTVLCDDGGDCAAGVSGNPLTACSPVTVSLPDGGAVSISMCARP